jgi:hypothetical protein
VRRQLADVFGGDHLKVSDGIALDVERFLHRSADTGDDDRTQFLGLGLLRLRCVGSAVVRRGVLRERHAGYTQAGDDAGG